MLIVTPNPSLERDLLGMTLVASHRYDVTTTKWEMFSMFELDKIHTDHNGSGMLTKNLKREKLEFVILFLEWQFPAYHENGEIC